MGASLAGIRETGRKRFPGPLRRGCRQYGLKRQGRLAFWPAAPAFAALFLSHELPGQTFGELGVFLRFPAADADAAD